MLGRSGRNEVNKGKQLSPKTGGIIFGLIGLAMIVGAYYTWSSNQKFLETAVRTTGVVTEIVAEDVRERDDDGYSYTETYYTPVVVYEGADGKEVKFRGKDRSTTSHYVEGQDVDVLYNPAVPGDVRIDSAVSDTLKFGGLGIAGVVFFLVGLGAFFFGKKKGVVSQKEASPKK